MYVFTNTYMHMFFVLYLNISCRLYSYDLPNQLQPQHLSAHRLGQAEGAASGLNNTWPWDVPPTNKGDKTLGIMLGSI